MGDPWGHYGKHEALDSDNPLNHKLIPKVIPLYDGRGVQWQEEMRAARTGHSDTSFVMLHLNLHPEVSRTNRTLRKLTDKTSPLIFDTNAQVFKVGLW